MLRKPAEFALNYELALNIFTKFHIAKVSELMQL